MKKIARILPLVGILSSFLNAYEYVYPVGTFIDFDGEQQVLSLYQKTPDHTELWQKSLTTSDANRALLSTFTPVGIAMLPENAGFSFFDNGRLRIKNFLKRSPKAIDIYEPIYDIGPLQWLTADLCIFHAKERDLFSLYTLCASNGSVTKIVSKEAFDCFYPSQIDSSLFYIEHKKNYESDPNNAGDYSIICLSQGKEPHCLVTHDKPLAFLTMFDQYHGLVIEHAGDVDSQKDKVFPCTCYKVLCDSTLESALLVKLFSFTLPLSLLLPSSKARLCESIYPLLPRKIGQAIYFVSCLDGEMQPFCYTDIKGVESLSIKAPWFGAFFTPLQVQTQETINNLMYGGSLQREFLSEDQEPGELLILKLY